MLPFEKVPKRPGVELVDLAGVKVPWQMPVALWNAPKGFDSRQQPDHQPCHVIALRLEGGLVKHVDRDAGRDEDLRPNGFSVHPARRDLRFVALAPIRFAHLYLTKTLFETVAAELGIFSNDLYDAVQADTVMYEDDMILEAAKSYVARAFLSQDTPTGFEMQCRSNLIALHLLQRHWRSKWEHRGTSGVMPPWQIQRICRHLEENTDRSVALKELADLVGLSVEHTCRTFRRTVGMPPLKWQAHKRMERARELLTTTNSSITSIAQRVGYTGQSAFGAAFREIVGVSPGRYRRFGPAGEGTGRELDRLACHCPAAIDGALRRQSR